MRIFKILNYSASFLILLVFLSNRFSITSFADPIDNPVRFDRSVFTSTTQNTGAFIQDKEGFLWIGTNASGLFRYDGYDVINCKNDGQFNLSDVYVFMLFEDKDGEIWIGTGDGGLNRYNKETNALTRYKHDPENPNSISYDAWDFWQSKSMCQDSDGNLWIGTANGLNMFDKKTGLFKRYYSDPSNSSSLSHNYIRVLMLDQAGFLWVGTNGGGLNRFDNRKQQFQTYQLASDQSRTEGSDRITALMEDRDGLIWTGTQNGLFVYNPITNSVSSYLYQSGASNGIAGRHILSLTEDNTGFVWITYVNMEQAGLTAYNKQTKTFTHYRHSIHDPGSLSSNMPIAVYQDRGENIWILHDSGPADKIDKRGPFFKLYRHDPLNPNTLQNPSVVPILQDSLQRIWIGTFPAGLSAYNKKNGIFTHYLNDKYYPGILLDTSGMLWLGSCTPAELILYDPQTRKKIKQYSHNASDPNSISHCMQINAIVRDVHQPHILWLATNGGGVEKFNRFTEQFTHFLHQSQNSNSINGNNLWMLHQDKNGILWLPIVGGGLDRYDPSTDQFTHFMHDPEDTLSISSNSVNVVFEDSSGMLWVGHAVGFEKFNPQTGEFLHFNANFGYPVSSIIEIGQDNDVNLWLGSAGGDGLIRFDPRTFQMKKFTEQDGLQSNVFYVRNALKDRDGEMWFGGIRGMNSFYPKEIINSIIPPIVITKLTQGEKSIVTDKATERIQSIMLDWQHNYFEFEYAALNFLQAYKNQYKYKLEGFDKDWFYAGNRRFGRYSGLPGGDYTLRVIGSNNDGIWNDTGVSLQIKVIPPWWRTWWFYGLIILSISGTALYVYGLKIKEIRATRSAAQKIRESEEQYRALFENIPVGIAVSTDDGHLIAVNDTLIKMIDSRNTTHKTIQKSTGFAYLSGMIASGDINQSEFNLRREDGSEFPVSLTKSAIKYQGMDADLITIIDSTEQKRNEANRRDLETQLFQAQKMESIGTLASGIAHDFNNILNIILHNVIMLSYGTLEAEKLQRRIDTATKAINRGARLVQQLLTFARKTETRISSIAVNDIIYDTVKLIEETFPKTIQIIMDLAPDIPTVRGDSNQLHQVFLNLCVNARDAMPVNGKLFFSSSLVPAKNLPSCFAKYVAKEYILISVKDTGSGIDKSIQKRIFDPFFSTKEPGKGTGLGLSVVLGIIESHQGCIELESSINDGAEFKIYLPVSEEGIALTTENEAKKMPASGGEETILLIEDEAMTREIVTEFLEEKGYSVISACDGEEGVEIFKHNIDTISLVISDIGLPKIDGEEVFRRIKSIRPSIPFILTSGYIDPEKRNTFEKLGLEALMPKPYLPQDILNKIREVIKPNPNN